MRHQAQRTFNGNTNPRLPRARVAALALGCVMFSSAVVAQQGPIEEIVVTATKRGETTLMDTPITVNVVSGDDLKFREIRDPEDLRTVVSGLYVDEGSSVPRVAVRGVGFDNFNVQAENGVTTYMDGVIVQRTHALFTGFLDLARVEVLKGPQGSAFGRNATGGAINLITARPVEGVSGEVSAGLGSRDRREVEAVLNYGGDTFGIRVAGSYEESDGYITNLATGNDDLGAREATLARIALSWDPTDSFSLDYTLNYAGYDTVGPGQDHTTALGAATAAGFGAALGLTPLLPLPGDPIGDSYTVVNAIDPFTDRESYLHALTLEFDLGWATLKSISGYMDFESFWRSDVGLPSGFAECMVCVLASITFSEQWSQELLLNGSTDKFNWVTGLYYLKEEATDEGAFNLNIAAPALPVGTVFENTGGGQDLTSYAIFADGTYALTDRFRVNGGLRWTDDKKEATGTTRDIVLPGGFRIPGASLEHLEEKDDTVTWQVGLEFDLNEEIFTYLRIAEGYKAGGINNNTGSFYLPEELISYEIGAKGVVSENFSLSVSGFYSEYENIQVFINPPDAPGAADIINAASATIAGIDFDADWQLTDMFSIDAQFTWLAEADYDEFLVNDFGVDQDLSGDQLTRSPEFTAVLGGNWHHTLNDRVQLTARAEVYMISKVVFSILHDLRPDGALSQDGYELVNIYLSATIDDKWDVRAYAKNIGDEFYISSATEGVPGFQYGIHGRPDQYGLEVSLRF